MPSATATSDLLSETSTGYRAFSASISTTSQNCPSLTNYMRPLEGLTGSQELLNPPGRSTTPMRTMYSSPQQQRKVQRGIEYVSGVPGFSSMGARRLNTNQRLLGPNMPSKSNPNAFTHGSVRSVHPLSSHLATQASVIRGCSTLNTGGSSIRQISHSPTIMSSHAASVYGNRSVMAPSSTGVTTYTASGQKIIGEYTTEEVMSNQKKVFVEETYDEVVIVPHKKIVEKFIDEPTTIRRRVVEVEVPQYVEREVEIPEIEYVEVEVPFKETVMMENVIRQPRLETVERIVEVPRIVYQEKIVEVPTIEYREVEHETIIEVPEEHIETKLVPKYIPQYVEVDVPEFVDVTEEENVDKNVPVPLEQVIQVQLKFPKIFPKYTIKEVPIYVPRFVEVPVPMDKLDDATLIQAQETVAILERLHNSDGPATLAQIESTVSTIVAQDWATVLNGLHGIPEQKNSPWATNFITSQIPVIMDAVMQVTADIQALGASQPETNIDEQEVDDTTDDPKESLRDSDKASTGGAAIYYDLRGGEPETERQLSLVEDNSSH